MRGSVCRPLFQNRKARFSDKNKPSFLGLDAITSFESLKNKRRKNLRLEIAHVPMSLDFLTTTPIPRKMYLCAGKFMDKLFCTDHIPLQIQPR